ncbi:MAG: BlaI/MecI/CopY family transcriptional regulator [Verrucomicrobiota bacterium]
MPSTPITLTDAEWAIIQAVWSLEPCPAPTVQEHLQHDRNWTYSTVRTLMDRMVQKRLLSAERLRNLTLYRSAVTREQAQRAELLTARKRAFNGALAPMFQCLLDVGSLSRDELEEVEQLIRAKRQQNRKK